jgi:hypothetical protein
MPGTQSYAAQLSGCNNKNSPYFQVATVKTALINNAGKELFAALFTYSLTTLLPMRMVSV